MESLLARYLDGDLDEKEAAALIDAASNDPSLDRSLRAYEQMLSAASVLTRPGLDEDFTDEVMARVATETASAARPPLDAEIPVSSSRSNPRARRSPRPSRGRAERPWLRVALAAGLAVVVFGAGFLSGRDDAGAPSRLAVDGSTPLSGIQPVDGPAVVSPAALGSAAAGARWVRFVYQSREAQPRTVYLAGTFNDWDTQALPLQWDGRIWSTLVLLPPGEHEYMFVEDGERWVTDPLAPRTLDDGFGGRNAVVEIRA